MKEKMKVKGNIECKFLIGRAGALRLRRRSGTLRRAGVLGNSEKISDFTVLGNNADQTRYGFSYTKTTTHIASYKTMLGMKFPDKKTTAFWLLANLSSIGILCLWFLCHAFFASSIDMFLLEFIAISCLAITNSKYFITTYNIHRTFRRVTLVYVIPMSIFIACATKFLYFTPIF